jgi:hypothetical protein
LIAVRAAFNELAEDLVFTHPLYMPSLVQPPDWTEWRTEYEGRINATFVKTNDPQTEAEITRAIDNRSIEPHNGPR